MLGNSAVSYKEPGGDPKDQIDQIHGVPSGLRRGCRRSRSRGHGNDASHEPPATVLNSLLDITASGGALGIPGLYVIGDRGELTMQPSMAPFRCPSGYRGAEGAHDLVRNLAVPGPHPSSPRDSQKGARDARSWNCHRQ